MIWTRISLAATSLAAFGVAAFGPEEVPTSARGEQAWSCQLHLHGSFSEGVGSIDSHSFEATDVGADVLWWSDHDYRINYYGMLGGFGFETRTQRVETDPLAAENKLGRRLWIYERHFDRRAVGGWDLVDDSTQGERSMRVHVFGQNERFETRFVRLGSDNSALTRPLAAGIRLRVAVKPSLASDDAAGVVWIDLSEHPERPLTEDSKIRELNLSYVIGGPAFDSYLERTTFHVHVPAAANEWSEAVLNVTKDAVRGFGKTVGMDNSLSRLGFGVKARKGTRFECLFDDLRIEEAVPRESMYARQRALIDEVAAGYPGLRQLQGAEISYASEHLNEFSVGTELLDYAAIAAELEEQGLATAPEFRRAVLEQSIAAAHARGGLISYNHMFGAAWTSHPKFDKRHQTLPEVSALIAQGIDLLEVGYVERGGQRLSHHLWVWDKLALQGLAVVGTGVSDSHGGKDQRWRTGDNNFVSWVYAPSTDKADLIEGLRAGRVFFGDLTVFDGAFDLRSDRGFVMGQIVLCDRDEVEVTIHVEGMRPSQTIHVIESGQQVDTLFLDDAAEPRSLALDPKGPTFIRAELHNRNDTPKVFTNGLHFVRQPPPAGIPAARAGLDYGGLVVVQFAGFELQGAERSEDGSVLVHGTATDGAFEVDTLRFGAVGEVTLEGLEGVVEVVDGVVKVSGLSGSGAIRFHPGS